mgnify:CR=1 FL=1
MSIAGLAKAGKEAVIKDLEAYVAAAPKAASTTSFVPLSSLKK